MVASTSYSWTEETILEVVRWNGEKLRNRYMPIVSDAMELLVVEQKRICTDPIFWISKQMNAEHPQRGFLK